MFHPKLRFEIMVESHKTRDLIPVFLVLNWGNIKLTAKKTEKRQIDCVELRQGRFSDSYCSFSRYTYIFENGFTLVELSE